MSRVAEFYDKMAAEQVARGFNARHARLLKKTSEAGIKPTSAVLELGCGVGTMTSALASLCFKGLVHGVDISPESIEIAKTATKAPNVAFGVGDLAAPSFTPGAGAYNFITLFDVLEHVPITDHQAVFFNLRKVSNEDTKILVHIPAPDHIEYLQEHTPEVLQVIDQSVWAHTLTACAWVEGFVLRQFTTHSIWMQGDYQWMEFGVRKPFKMVPRANAPR